jgi:hypothetical protein
MLDQAQENALAQALRDADYASLTRCAATDNSRALADEVLRLIATVETRKRQRGTKAKATLRQAVEGFVGDLLVALAKARHNDGAVAITEHANSVAVAGWVRRSTSSNSFSGGPVSFRTFDAIRAALTALGLVEEVPGVTQFREVFGKQFVLNRYDTRWRATARLEELAAARGLSLLAVGRHFVAVPELPLHPLVLKGTSTWLGGYKITGKRMKIVCTAEVKALEQTIIGLNTFIDKFTIVGGKHHGYIREFNCGDHPSFAWDLGGRLYSAGAGSYQGLTPDERKLMTIDGRPVIELDIRASALTIFHGQRGQPLDFEANPDPYTLHELRDTPRDVVKKFITATFGKGQLPARWPQKQAHDYKEERGQSLSKQHPISQVRSAVARAYPLLAELRRDDAKPPLWAKLMYLESEAILRTMLTLADLGIPSLSVQDSIIVPQDSVQLAKSTLSVCYRSTTGAIPYVPLGTLSCDPSGPPVTNNDKGTVQQGAAPGRLHPTNLLLRGGQKGKVDPGSIPK